MELVLAILSIFSNYGIINMTYENLNKIIKKKKSSRPYFLVIITASILINKLWISQLTHHIPYIHMHSACTHTNHLYTHNHIHLALICKLYTQWYTHTQWMYAHTMHTHIICTLKQGSTLYSRAHCMHILHTHITCTHYVYTHNTHTQRSKKQAHIKEHFYNLLFQFNNMLRKPSW